MFRSDQPGEMFQTEPVNEGDVSIRAIVLMYKYIQYKCRCFIFLFQVIFTLMLVVDSTSPTLFSQRPLVIRTYIANLEEPWWDIIQTDTITQPLCLASSETLLRPRSVFVARFCHARHVFSTFTALLF